VSGNVPLVAASLPMGKLGAQPRKRQEITTAVSKSHQLRSSKPFELLALFFWEEKNDLWKKE